MPSKFTVVALLISLACAFQTNACPTCVGRIAPDSAPFFADECYEWQANQQDAEQSSDKKEHTS